MIQNVNSDVKDTPQATDSPDLVACDALTEILRTGAQKMLKAAIEQIEQEVLNYVNDRTNLLDENGRRLVVRNGSLPEREILTGVGPVAVCQPRMRDKRPVENVKFSLHPFSPDTFARQNQSKN